MFQKTFSVLKSHSRRLLSLQSGGIDWAKQEKILIGPIEYIQNVPNKHYRLYVSSFNHWLQIPEDKLNGIQDILQTFLTFNIISDDIQDESDYRYGVPAAHKVYGVSFTINAVSKAIFLGLKQVMKLGHPSGLGIIIKRIEEFVDGQGTDLYWGDNLICPSIDAHLEIARKKGGSYFAFPVELMQLFSSNKTDFVELASNIGVYYNILDDYYNLFYPKALEKQASIIQDVHIPCSDIAECKLTLAIVHALHIPDVAGELTDILKKRTRDPKLQKRAIELLKKHGSDEYMKDTLAKMDADIRSKIHQLGGNTMLTDMLDDLTFRIQEPKYMSN